MEYEEVRQAIDTILMHAFMAKCLSP